MNIQYSQIYNYSLSNKLNMVSFSAFKFEKCCCYQGSLPYNNFHYEFKNLLPFLLQTL